MSAMRARDWEWHGEKAYGVCRICKQMVQVNKKFLGGLHDCLTDCQQAGRHLDLKTRRRGPFWKRRTERYCDKCNQVEGE